MAEQAAVPSTARSLRIISCDVENISKRCELKVGALLTLEGHVCVNPDGAPKCTIFDKDIILFGADGIAHNLMAKAPRALVGADRRSNTLIASNCIGPIRTGLIRNCSSESCAVCATDVASARCLSALKRESATTHVPWRGAYVLI